LLIEFLHVKLHRMRGKQKTKCSHIKPPTHNYKYILIPELLRNVTILKFILCKKIFLA
jgi:hypothetical protein